MEEKTLLHATLVFLVRNDQVLLYVKTRNIGMGLRNGLGGGIEPEDVTPEDGVLRELRVESGGHLTVEKKDLEKVAIVYFYNTKADGEKFVCKCHVYILRKWIGKPGISKEMISPAWFDIDNLPFDAMMPGDVDWVPLVLEGKKIIARVYYGKRQESLVAPTEWVEVTAEELK